MKPEQVEYDAPGPGQCILHNLDGRLFVERADPVVAIAGTLVTQLRDGSGHGALRMDGRTLVIDAANQRVCYRLEPSGQPGYLLGRLT